MSELNKTRIKKLLYWAILIGFVYMISQNLTDFRAILNILRRGNLLLIAAAFVLQLLFVFFMSQNIRTIFLVMGIRVSIKDVMREYLAMSFINVLTPFGSAGGMLYMGKKISEKTYLGIPGVLVAMYAAYWVLTLFYIVELVYAIVALDFMGFKGLSPIVIAFLGLLVIQVLVFGVITASYKRPVLLKRIVFSLREIFGTLGGLMKNSALGWGDSKINDWLDDINLASHVLFENIESRDIALTSFYGLLTNLTQFLILWILFAAFQIEVSLFQVLLSHAIIYLFTIVSPTPSGIGIVEGIAQLVFVGIGVPKDAAVVITFAYRGITMWFPVMIGFFAFRSGSKGSI